MSVEIPHARQDALIALIEWLRIAFVSKCLTQSPSHVCQKASLGPLRFVCVFGPPRASAFVLQAQDQEGFVMSVAILRGPSYCTTSAAYTYTF